MLLKRNTGTERRLLKGGQGVAKNEDLVEGAGAPEMAAATQPALAATEGVLRGGRFPSQPPTQPIWIYR